MIKKSRRFSVKYLIFSLYFVIDFAIFAMSCSDVLFNTSFGYESDDILSSIYLAVFGIVIFIITEFIHKLMFPK